MKNFAEQNSTIGKEYLFNTNDRRETTFTRVTSYWKADTCQELVHIRLLQYLKFAQRQACCQQGSGVPVESPQKQSLTIWSQREESIIWISLTGKRKVGNIHRHF